MKRKDVQKMEVREEKSLRFLAQIVSPWQQDTGIEVPRSYAFKDFLSVYGEGALANVWVFRAVRAISEAQAQLPLLLQAKNRKEEWETIQSGSLFRLFEDINPNMTYYDYTEAESIYMELTGNCFLALENPSPNTKLPREIWPIRPDLVRIHPDKETGEVLGYTVHLGEGQKPLLYSRDEMLHRKYFNPTNWFWGASPLQAYKMGLTFEYYTKQYENNFFKHGVRETGILTSGGPLNDKQFERLKKQVEARYGGIDMMHRPMVLEGGLDWKRISVPPKDMEYKELKRWNKEEAEAIYNIPPLKMMDMEATSRLANADIQERLFWSDTIIPRLKKREGFYEEWLFPFYFKKSELSNYRLRHNLSEVKSLQASEKDKAELAVKLTSGINPIFSVDEARERFYSFGPAPWGGKEPLVPVNLMPASFVNTGRVLTEGSQTERFFDILAEKIAKKIKGNGERKLIEGEVLEVIEEDNDNKDDTIVDKYSEDYIWSIQPEFEISEEQQQYWREWAVKRLKEEDRFVRALNVEFRRELNETLNNLNKLNEGQLIPVKSLLFDESHAINNMRDTYLSNFGFIFRNVSNEEMNKWGLTNPVNYDSPTVIEYGRNQASWFAGTGRENLRPGQYPGVTGTQLERLENTFNEGYRLGESVDELTKRAQNVFAGTIREKGYAARRIARTETIRLANFSRLTQYQRNKHIVSQKQWLAQLDARTDEICAMLHGEVVDLEANFPGGYYQPPDPHVSCRCALLPTIREKIEEVLEEKPVYDFNKTEDLNRFIMEGKADLIGKLGNPVEVGEGLYNPQLRVGLEKKFNELFPKVEAVSNEVQKLTDLVGKIKAGDKKFFEEGRRGVSQLFNKRSLGELIERDRAVDVEIIASHNRSTYLRGTMNIKKGSTEDFVHEFGHYYEQYSVKGKQAIQNFYKERTLGEELSPWIGNSKEMVKKDKFMEQYMGKVYEGGETEVFSVGSAKFLNPRAALEFYSQDPEHFSLIYRLLLGEHL